MRVGIFRGTADDSTNQYHERLFLGWGVYLSNLELDAFGSADFPDSAEQYYNRVTTKDHKYRTPFTKILAVYKHTREYIQRRDPDVLVQVRNFATHATGVTLAGWTSNIPVVIRYPSDGFNEFRKKSGLEKGGVFALQNICGRIPLQLAEKAIVLGPHGKSLLMNRGVETEAIEIIPPPEDTTGRFQPCRNQQQMKSELGLPMDRRICLYVGRLTETKGMEFARSVIQQTQSVSNVFFVLVGEGPCRDRFQDEFDDDILHMPGHVDYSEIDKYYKSSDIYMHPSPYEGIPLSILEALDCGIPVVARPAGDIEMVTPNTVTTPDKMSELVIEPDLKSTWLNRHMFEKKYQSDALHKTISDATS